MDLTANNTVYMIRMTGIPVYQDGFHFILPSGSWSVVEECSGIRYLIATVTLGIVYSYVTYASVKKRLIFTLLSFIVPILANTLRAYIIVLLGHYSGMKIAVGTDHILYGWVLFGIIIFILFYIGNFWRDSRDEFNRKAPVSAGNSRSGRAATYLSVGIILIVLIQLFYHSRTISPDQQISTNESLEALSVLDGWQITHTKSLSWKPVLQKPDLDYNGIYQNHGFGASANGTQTNPVPVQLDIGYYLVQRNGHETVSTQNRQIALVKSRWKITGSHVVQHGQYKVQETIILSGNKKLVTWMWYRVGDYQTRNPYKAKLYEVYMRIFQNRSDGAYISIATPVVNSVDTARARLAAFFDASNESINEEIESIHRNFKKTD
jgi:EpsI family protein